MSGVAVEDLLALWSAELRVAKARLRPLFAQPATVRSAAAFLEQLLGPERRKTGWMRAEAAGDPGPWRQQAVRSAFPGTGPRTGSAWRTPTRPRTCASPPSPSSPWA